LELDESDLGALDLGGATGGVRSLLLEDGSVGDELSIIDRATESGDDADVTEIDVAVGAEDAENGIDGHGGEGSGVLTNNLGVEGSDGGLDQSVAVGDIDGDGHLFEDGLSLLGGQLEVLGDLSGVDTAVEEVFDGLQESTAENDDGGGTITGFNVLSLRELDKHLGAGMCDLELGDDGGTIVGNDDLTVGVDDHLIHTSGTERSANTIGDTLGSSDVAHADILLFRVVLFGFTSILLGRHCDFFFKEFFFGVLLTKKYLKTKKLFYFFKTKHFFFKREKRKVVFKGKKKGKISKVFILFLRFRNTTSW
jgi:hypothetical protein